MQRVDSDVRRICVQGAANRTTRHQERLPDVGLFFYKFFRKLSAIESPNSSGIIGLSEAATCRSAKSDP
jgi:hypothetical protein